MGSFYYLAGHHRRMLSRCGNASISLLFLSRLKCEKGSMRKGRMDQLSVMVAAFVMTKAVLGTHVGTPILDVAGGSRSRIKPSFSNSEFCPSISELTAGWQQIESCIRHSASSEGASRMHLGLRQRPQKQGWLLEARALDFLVVSKSCSGFWQCLSASIESSLKTSFTTLSSLGS